MKNTLCMVVPCYNEEEILETTTAIMKQKLQKLINSKKISENSKIMLVDDGSYDKTWKIISKLHKSDKHFIGIKLSKNEGHQNALLAGLLTAKQNFDITISLDADLQDDINAIDEMIEKFLNGYEIVYGIRNDRKNDSFIKKTTANLFYKIMNFLGAKTINNHADFRLMSRKALDALANFKEVNLFLRGIIPMIGYKSTSVYYERKKRSLGTSKYTIKKMLKLAINGITSFSAKLISLIFITGIIAVLISILMLILLTSNKIKFTDSLTIFSIWFMGGINLISISILGTYVGKTYLETKNRPRFFIEETLE